MSKSPRAPLATRIKDRVLYQILRQDDRNKPWVFNIGLSKTGTTSLNDALRILGYDAYHLPPIIRSEPTPGGRIEIDWTWWVHQYNALTDLSVAAVWRELDERYPNAKFIYTTRSIEKWLDSCRRHFTIELHEARIEQRQTYLNDLSIAFYGARSFDRDSFQAAYEAHDAAVMQHFQGRDDFLQYDLTSGAGWEPLCDFLELPIPETPYPVSNVGQQEKRKAQATS